MDSPSPADSPGSLWQPCAGCRVHCSSPVHSTVVQTFHSSTLHLPVRSHPFLNLLVLYLSNLLPSCPSSSSSFSSRVFVRHSVFHSSAEFPTGCGAAESIPSTVTAERRSLALFELGSRPIQVLTFPLQNVSEIGSQHEPHRYRIIYENAWTNSSRVSSPWTSVILDVKLLNWKRCRRSSCSRQHCSGASSVGRPARPPDLQSNARCISRSSPASRLPVPLRWDGLFRDHLNATGNHTVYANAGTSTSLRLHTPFVTL